MKGKIPAILAPVFIGVWAIDFLWWFMKLSSRYMMFYDKVDPPPPYIPALMKVAPISWVILTIGIVFLMIYEGTKK